MSVEPLFEVGEISITSISGSWKNSFWELLISKEVGSIFLQRAISCSKLFMGIPPFSFGLQMSVIGFLVEVFSIEHVPYSEGYRILSGIHARNPKSK